MTLRLHSLPELIETMERMADWRERIDRRLGYYPFTNFDVLQLAAEVKAWTWCARCIEKAIKK